LIRLRPRTVKVAAGAEERLQAAARSLTETGADESASQLLVQFGLGGEPHAVELWMVERAVTSFPEIVPLAGAPARVCGAAFLEGVAHIVVDLLEATGRPRRKLEILQHSPALVVDREGVPLALAVEGPLELAEVSGTWRASTSSASGVGVAGRLPSGVLVLASEWLRQFITEVG
jgi:chemotaxis signal transduction protein